MAGGTIVDNFDFEEQLQVNTAIYLGNFSCINAEHVAVINKLSSMYNWVTVVVLCHKEDYLSDTDKKSIFSSMKGVSEVILCNEDEEGAIDTLQAIFARSKDYKEHFFIYSYEGLTKGETFVCSKYGVKVFLEADLWK